MTGRLILASALAIATTAAGAPPASFAINSTVSPYDRSPPTVPSRPGGITGFTPAPVPNVDAPIPLAPTAQAHAEVTPGFWRPNATYRGEAFVPGSTAQTTQEQRLKPTPGINLKVPLN